MQVPLAGKRVGIIADEREASADGQAFGNAARGGASASMAAHDIDSPPRLGALRRSTT